MARMLSVPKEYEAAFAGFPAALQALVLAELEAGNTIVELTYGFPAAPCGACIRLARTVTSRARERTTELDFYDRDTSTYSGEFTDAKRHYFVLEPPRPTAPRPDMDAIRAELERKHDVVNVIRSPLIIPKKAMQPPANGTPPAVMVEETADPHSIIGRFKASMVMDFDKWHDGIGYDLSLIAQAIPEERAAIEDLLIERNIADWRDVEALAALGSRRAHAALLIAVKSSDAQIRMAVHTHAPELLAEAERTASLVKALEHEHFYGGLTAALLAVETFHPPAIISALLRGLLEREGEVACHFAAMLYFLHGKASSAFDMEQRPFFLRFNTTDVEERVTAVRELCNTLGFDPDRWN